MFVRPVSGICTSAPSFSLGVLAKRARLAVVIHTGRVQIYPRFNMRHAVRVTVETTEANPEDLNLPLSEAYAWKRLRSKVSVKLQEGAGSTRTLNSTATEANSPQISPDFETDKIKTLPNPPDDVNWQKSIN